MYTNDQICEKIRSVYSDIGECGIDINVTYSTDNKAWVVDLKKKNDHLQTYLDHEDTDSCMEGRQCIGLGFQISQLKDNIQHLREV